MQFFPKSLRWFNSFKCAFYVHKRNVCMEVLINTRKNEGEMFYSDVQQSPQVRGQEWSPLNAENFTTKNKCDAEIRESP